MWPCSGAESLLGLPGGMWNPGLLFHSHIPLTPAGVSEWQGAVPNWQQTLQAPTELQGAWGWARVLTSCPKGTPASSERQISSQESGQWGSEELGAVQPSLQMQSPGASPSFEDLLPTPYPALVPPGLRQNLAFLPRNLSFLQIDGFYLDP